MSATVDAQKISDYFGGCPTLQVPGRTFPVDVRFLEDAIETTQWHVTESSPYALRGMHLHFYSICELELSSLTQQEETGTNEERIGLIGLKTQHPLRMTTMNLTMSMSN